MWTRKDLPYLGTQSLAPGTSFNTNNWSGGQSATSDGIGEVLITVTTADTPNYVVVVMNTDVNLDVTEYSDPFTPVTVSYPPTTVLTQHLVKETVQLSSAQFSLLICNLDTTVTAHFSVAVRAVTANGF